MVEGAYDMTEHTTHLDETDQQETAVPPPETSGLDGSGEEGGKLDRIRARIERTEASMDGALNAIQEKLSLQYIIELAEEKILSTTITEAEEMMKRANQAAGSIGKTLADTFREYPISTSLVGVALTWFLYKGVRGGAESAPMGYRGNLDYRGEMGDTQEGQDEALYHAGLEEPGGYRYHQQGEYSSSTASTAGTGGAVRSAFDKVRDVAENVQEKTMDFAGSIQDKTRDIAGNVQEKTMDFARGALEKGKHLGDMGMNVGDWNRSGIGRSLRDNALTVGIVAVGIGLGIGLILPETRIEQELMGEKQQGILRSARHFSERAMNLARTLLTGNLEERPKVPEQKAEPTVEASSGENLPASLEDVDTGSHIQ
jgi:hypothetical protein